MRGFIEEDLSSDSEVGKRLCPSAYCRQIHGTRILYAAKPGRYDDCDGLFTDIEGLNLAIRTADCNSVTMESDDPRIVMNLHVGWRGAASAILQKGLGIFSNREIHMKDIRVHIFPGARVCCYEIGADIFPLLGEEMVEFVVNREGFFFLDLKAYIEKVLRAAGVKWITCDPRCTICGNGLYSYRRDKTEKRNCGFVKIEENNEKR